MRFYCSELETLRNLWRGCRESISNFGYCTHQRANGAAAHVDLAGFPHHAIDTYLPKLVRAGYRVAICEQLEDPKLTKS